MSTAYKRLGSPCRVIAINTPVKSKWKWCWFSPVCVVVMFTKQFYYILHGHCVHATILLLIMSTHYMLCFSQNWTQLLAISLFSTMNALCKTLMELLSVQYFGCQVGKFCKKEKKESLWILYLLLGCFSFPRIRGGPPDFIQRTPRSCFCHYHHSGVFGSWEKKQEYS